MAPSLPSIRNRNARRCGTEVPARRKESCPLECVVHARRGAEGVLLSVGESGECLIDCMKQ